MYRYLLPLCLFFVLPAAVHATHIVGGEIGYKCLGNNQYEVTLSVYRDCINGAANAQFDDPAFIAIYDEQTKLLINVLEIPYVDDDTISTVLTDPCLVVLEPVCVHTTTYRGVVTLAYRPGGYRIAYQRCCRNMTILNIVDPLATGATYDITLTGPSMLNCNSSPKFKEWPPIYVCTSRPLVFDHSAFDEDGDSLVYKLCTPFSGGTLAVPQPMPATPPPYDTVVWKSPLFSLNNVLGAGVPLQVNPVTGLMTATPGITGQFVVGVCVEEYDAETGILLSVTRRDFQYNVNPCGDITSVLVAPAAQCDNLTVTFQNESTNATGYQWYFDYPNQTPGSTTLDPVVQHTFPDTGYYQIALIAEPNSQCADTTIHDLFLQYNSLTADFQVDVFDCQNQALVQVTDLSTDAVSPPSVWNWTLTYGNQTLTSTQQNPLFTVPLGITGTLTLVVQSQNGCESTLTKTFQTGLDNPEAYLADTIRACVGSVVGLNPNTPANISFNYVWSPTTGLSDPTAVNPTITVTANTQYTVTVTPINNICQIVHTVHVIAVPQPEAAFTADPDCDGLTIQFTNNSPGADAFFWEFGDPNTQADTSLLPNPGYSYPAVGTYPVTFIASAGGLCFDTITQNVSVLEVLLSADFGANYLNCSEDSVVVQLIDESFNNQNNTVSWSWTLSNGSSSNDPSPVFVFYESQSVDVTLTITTADDCSATRTSTIDIVLLEDIDQFPDTLIVCPGDSVQIAPGGNPAYTYQWTPAIGLDNPQSPNPVFFPGETTLYSVLVSANGVDTCQTTETVLVIVPPVINLQLNTQSNIDTCLAEIDLTTSTDTPATIQWFNALDSLLATGNTFTVHVSGSQSYTILATDASGCIDTLTATVSGGPVDIEIPEIAPVCLGEELIAVVNNLDPNDMLTYVWSPSTLFVPGTENTATPDIIEMVGQHEISVTVTNQYGCFVTQNFVVTVVDTAMQLGFDYEVQCDGATVEFTNTSTNAFGYVWYFGDGTTSTEVNPTHAYTAAGDYTVLLTIAFDVSCTDTIARVITVQEPQIVADWTFDIIECTPDSVVVAFYDASTNTFNNTIGWSWTFSNGQTSNEQNPVITFTESGPVIVTLTITSANNCSASVTDTIQIDIIEVSLSDTIVVCSGESAPLNPNGNPDYTYNWSPATGLSDPNIANPIVTPTETTTYTVTISSLGADTCAYTTQVVVFVPAAINPDAGPDITTCGEDVPLELNTDVPAEIAWYDLNGNLLGTGSPFVVNPFRDSTFVGVATDQYGCVASDTITIIDHGVDIETEPDGDIIVACQGVQTLVSVSNLDNLDSLTYFWFPDNIIEGPNDESNVIFVVNEGSATLTGIITNQYGCSDTVNFTITIVPFEITLQDTINACYGEPIPLNPDGNPNYTYVWTPSEGLNNPNIANPLFIGDETTTYTVLITDNSNGILCQIERQVTVVVSEPINLTVSPSDTLVCSLDTLLLTANSTQQGVEFEWYNSAGVSIGTGSTIEVAPVIGTNIYTVIATDLTGCKDTATATIIATDFQPAISTEVLACFGQATPLNPDGNPSYTYQWSPTTGLDLSNPSNPVAVLFASTVYGVTITDPISGCQFETQVTVTVPPNINLDAIQDTVICQSETLTLLGQSDVPDVEFVWYDNPALLNPVGEGATLTVTPAVSTTYYLTAMDQFGCTQIDSARVDLFPIQAVITPDIVLCEPTDTVTLAVTNLIPNQPLTFVWSPANAIYSATDGPVVSVNPNVSNVFTVIVTNPAGCKDTLSTTVTVIDLGNLVAVTASPDTILLGESSTLTVTGCDNCDITWVVPSGTINPGSGPIVVATPDEAGENIYTIIAGQLICTVEIPASVYVINAICDEDHVFLPNAFTPNNDGDNDVLRLRSNFLEDLLEVELMIYNRWGEEVFRTQNPFEFWDGTYKGEQLPPDVYGFYLRVVCPDEQELVKKGNITLIR